jgi:hypothetical protein
MTRFTFAFAALMLVFAASPSWAVPMGALQIQFTGLNLSYDGATITDAGSPDGGNCDPNEADPLDTVEFKVNGSSVGLLTSADDIYMDLSIPDVTGLSDNNIVTNVTSGPGSYFHLLIGPNAEEYLKLEADEVTVIYLKTSNTVQFVYGGSVASVNGQNLPFDVTVGQNVSVSFSTKVDDDSKTTDQDNFVTGFTSSGTGEISGQAVPEPAVCLLAAVSVIGVLLTRTRA